MTRDVRSPVTNTIINTVAGYLDLSQLYGSTVEVANALRNSDGTLKSSDNGQALPVVNGSFVTGDPRVMENPELTALTILFMREHNFWVGKLNPNIPHGPAISFTIWQKPSLRPSTKISFMRNICLS